MSYAEYSVCVRELGTKGYEIDSQHAKLAQAVESAQAINPGYYRIWIERFLPNGTIRRYGSDGKKVYDKAPR